VAIGGLAASSPRPSCKAAVLAAETPPMGFGSGIHNMQAGRTVVRPSKNWVKACTTHAHWCARSSCACHIRHSGCMVDLETSIKPHALHR
jgi:hypothetical protein